MLQGIIAKLRALPGARLNAGASVSDIEAAESASDLRLPDDLRSFFLACNGCDFTEGGSKFLSLTEGDSMRRTLEEVGLHRSWRYWPVVESDDSNPICVCCAGPLAGHVIHVFHDMSPQIKWKRFANFLDSAVDCIAADECCLEFMDHEFQRQERSAHDVATARALFDLIECKEVGDAERADLCRFSSWLMGNEQVGEVARFLKTEDEYVRRDICDRLKAMKCADARRALIAYEEEFRAFVIRSGEILTGAGMRISVGQHSQLQVMDGPIHLNMEMFYNGRANPNFDQLLVDRVKQMVKS